MAIDATIEFEDGDEDEFLNRLDNKTDSSKDAPRPQSTEIEDDQTILDGMTEFTPGKKGNKKQEQEVNKRNRAANRRRREEMADRKRAMREEQQDKERARRAEARERKQVSKDQVLQSRTEAISNRIGIYSLASSLGLQGYVAASIVDNLYLRPKEQQETGAQLEYQQQLERYNEALKSDAIQQQRAQQEAIRNTPVTATPLGPTGAPLPPGSFPPLPPSPPPPNQPPILPPSSPIPQGPGMIGQLAGQANLVAGLLQATQVVNGYISNIASAANNIGAGIASNNAVQGSQAILGGAKAAIGFNTTALVAIEGFNTLLSINQSILDSIKGNLGFAPQTLQANVQSDILKLSRQIESSQRLDKVTAELIKANTTLDEAWNGLRTEFLEDIGPSLVTILNFISTHIKGMTVGLDLISNAANVHIPGSLGSIFHAIRMVLDVLYRNQNNQLDNADIMKQIDDFFNVPLNIGRLPKGANPI
jgi:hypothetical protein